MFTDIWMNKDSIKCVTRSVRIWFEERIIMNHILEYKHRPKFNNIKELLNIHIYPNCL